MRPWKYEKLVIVLGVFFVGFLCGMLFAGRYTFEGIDGRGYAHRYDHWTGDVDVFEMGERVERAD